MKVLFLFMFFFVFCTLDLLVVTQALESCTLVMMFIMLIVTAFYVTSPAVRILKTAVAILIMGFVSCMYLNIAVMQYEVMHSEMYA